MARASFETEGINSYESKERNAISLLCYAVAFIGLALSAVLTLVDHALTSLLYVGAFISGWAEVDGLCGVSHVCSITPLRAFRPRHLWLKAACAYTIAGCMTAAGVGWLASSGASLLDLRDPVLYAIAIGVAFLLTLREWGYLKWRLPQVRRQTHKMWAAEYGFPQGAAMWGAHIGLGVVTVIRHGGIYVVLIAATTLEAAQAAALFTVFWLGRSAPLWLVPAVTESNDGLHLTKAILGSARANRFVSSSALILLALALAERMK